VNEAERLIEQFFEGLWNRDEPGLPDRILSDDLHFRGTLGSEASGREQFLAYVAGVRSAFPDWHCRIEEIIDAGDRAAARMTFSGTHRGELRGLAPTGRRVSYPGVTLFRFERGRIAEVWALGDTQQLWSDLGVLQLPETG
jgi:steroid delta-isomerase-like uncharacterized protein